MLVSSA